MTGGVLAKEIQCGRVALTLEEMWAFRCGPGIFGRVSLGLEIDIYRKEPVPFWENGRQIDRLFQGSCSSIEHQVWAGLRLPACTGSQRGGASVRAKQSTLVRWLLISLYRGWGSDCLLCTTGALHVPTTIWTSSVKVDSAPKWQSQNALIHIECWVGLRDL